MTNELNLKPVYRSDSDNILKDFLIPCLKKYNRYDRASGFFSSSIFYNSLSGLSHFVNNDGKIRLIIGHYLSDKDLKSFESNLSLLDNRLLTDVDTIIDGWEREIKNDLFWKRVDCLAYLIMTGRLEMKVAVKSYGMYHEKIGFFYNNDQKDSVFFQGSMNETYQAASPEKNHESINVFDLSNEVFIPHAEPHRKAFERLWNDSVEGCRVVSLPKAISERLIKKLPTGGFQFSLDDELRMQSPTPEIIVRRVDEPYIPEKFKGDDFELEKHQKKALKEWKEANYKGVLELCTGAGKTITSIFGAIRLFEAKKNLFLIISVPYKALAEQWVDSLSTFNISPVKCWSDYKWKQDLDKNINHLNNGNMKFLCLVVVNKTMTSEKFKSKISTVKESVKKMFIGDECHHHSSDTYYDSLPSNFSYRMGLSATVEEGSRLFDYYGEVVSRFEIQDAIKLKLLTEYDYHPIVCELRDHEVRSYVEISEQISSLEAKKKAGMDVAEENLGRLYGLRSSLIGNAEDKIIKLREFLESNEIEHRHTLFYCSPKSPELEIRQTDLVSSLLSEQGWSVGHFTTEESMRDRMTLLNQFKNNKGVNALISIKCLDEGFDVPAIRTAFILASSSSKKQFVQRRGRVLRRDEGKDYAVIYDFITVVPEDCFDQYKHAKKLFSKEFKRFMEFASSSRNKRSTYTILRPYLKMFNMEHLF